MLLSNSEYLRVIASTLSKDVLPELHSPNALARAEISIGALRQLMKREASLLAVVTRFTPTGMFLLERMIAALQQIGETLGKPLDDLRSATGNQHGDVQQTFSDLVRLLDDGARKLIIARFNGEATNQDDTSLLLRDLAEWESGYYTAFTSLPLPEINERTESVKNLTREKLETHLRTRLPEYGHLEVREFTSVPGGFSNETFFFTLHSEKFGTKQLVIRKNASHPFFSFWAHRAREEFQIVTRVHATGLPVPQPLWLFKDMPDVDGDYYVATRGWGRIIGSLSGLNEVVPKELLLDLAKFLAELHYIPLKHFEDYLAIGDTPVSLGDTVQQAVTKNVEYLYKEWLSCVRLPSPSEAFTIDWLRRNVPANSNSPVIVHSDCFVHNFLVSENKISIVVDWEAAHFGDPAEDLAYIRDQVSELMEWREFLAHYHACGGQPIDETSLNYYKCLSNFRNCFGTNIGVTRILNGHLDVRMLPLGSDLLSAWMKICIESTRPTNP